MTEKTQVRSKDCSLFRYLFCKGWSEADTQPDLTLSNQKLHSQVAGGRHGASPEQAHVRSLRSCRPGPLRGPFSMVSFGKLPKVTALKARHSFSCLHSHVIFYNVM